MASLVCSPLQMYDYTITDEDTKKHRRYQGYFIDVFSDEKKSPLIIDLQDIQCLDGIRQEKLIGLTEVSDKAIMSFRLSEKEAEAIHDPIKNYLQKSDILYERYTKKKHIAKQFLIDILYSGFSVFDGNYDDGYDDTNPLIVHSLMPVTKNDQMDQTCCKLYVPNLHKVSMSGICVPWQKSLIEKYYWDKLMSHQTAKPIPINQLRLHISHITLNNNGIFVHTSVKSIQISDNFL